MNGPTRLVALLAVGGSVLAAGAALAPADAAAPDCTRGPVPIGAPQADVGTVEGAGYVEIRRGCDAAKAGQRLVLPHPKAGDNFGAAITDVDLTGGTGLLVGIPNYDVGGLRNAGAIASYSLTSKGLRLERIITQNSPGVPGAAQSGAQFGSVLVTLLDISGESESGTVRVGVPRYDVGRARDAGAVVDLALDNDGVFDGKDSRLVTLNSKGVRGTPHPYDRFGAAIGGRSLDMIGVPGREVAGRPGAGAVLDGSRWISQRTACVPGTPEAGDHFGATLSGDYIGVPGEDVDGAADAGLVSLYAYDFDGGYQCGSLTELSKGFQGEVHAGDRFGAALYLNHTYFDSDYFVSSLFIGAPGADTTAGKNSGSVSFVNLKNENEDNDDVPPGKIIQTGRGFSTAVTSAPGQALGTAVGPSYSRANPDGDGYILASAPGGPGRVYALGGNGKTLVVNHVYRPTDTRPGTYGRTLVATQ